MMCSVSLHCRAIQGACRFSIFLMPGILQKVLGVGDRSFGENGVQKSFVWPVLRWTYRSSVEQ